MKIEEVIPGSGADMTAEESLALGDSYFVDEDFDQSVDAYAAALLVLRDGDNNGALKIRILSHRSAAFHRMRRDEDAFEDAKEALDLIAAGEKAKTIAGLRAGEGEILNKRAGVAALNLQQYKVAKVFFEAAQQLAKLNRGDEKTYKSYLKQCDYHLKPKAVPSLPDMSAALAAASPAPAPKPVIKEEKPVTKTPASSAAPKAAPKIITESAKKPTPPKPVNPNKKPVSGMPKYQYYQNDKFVTVSLLESNVKPEDLDVRFEHQHLTVKLMKGGTNYTVISGNTYSEVNVEQCKINFKGEKVLIKLKKETLAFEWQELLGKKTFPTPPPTDKKEEQQGETKQDEDGKATAPPSKVPTVDASKPRPYASHKDWNKIEKDLEEQEKNEKPEGDEAMNKLFKQIYSTADEDTKRAMVKSYQTSGGTVLSTNWGEVKEKNYEKERTAPKGMEWKSWEGDKLPMKDDD